MVLGENIFNFPNAQVNAYSYEHSLRTPLSGDDDGEAGPSGYHPQQHQKHPLAPDVPHANVHVYQWDEEEGSDEDWQSQQECQQQPAVTVERVPLFSQRAPLPQFGQVATYAFPESHQYRNPGAAGTSSGAPRPEEEMQPPHPGSSATGSASALTFAMRSLPRDREPNWPRAGRYPTQVVKLRPLEEVLASRSRSDRGSRSIDIPPPGSIPGSSYSSTHHSTRTIAGPPAPNIGAAAEPRPDNASPFDAAPTPPLAPPPPECPDGAPAVVSQLDPLLLNQLLRPSNPVAAPDPASADPGCSSSAAAEEPRHHHHPADALLQPLPPLSVTSLGGPSFQGLPQHPHPQHNYPQQHQHHYQHQFHPPAGPSLPRRSSSSSLFSSPLTQHPHHHHHHQSVPPSPSIREKSPEAVFNISANCLAVGLLALPVVFANLGVLLATTGLFLACAFSYFAALVLIRQAHRQGFPSYSGAALAHFGPVGQLLLSASAVVCCWLLALFCFVAFEDSLLDREGGLLSEALLEPDEDWFIARPLLDIAVVVLVLPFLSMKRWSSFSTHSIAVTAMGTCFVATLVMVAAAGVAGGRLEDLNLYPSTRFMGTNELSCRDAKDMMFVVPYILYAFLLQHNIHPTMEATWGARNRSQDSSPLSYHRSMSWSLLGTFVLYCLTAISGTVVIGKDPTRHHSHELLIRSFSLENLEGLVGSEDHARAAKWALSGSYALLLLLSLPLVLWPLEDHLKQLLGKLGHCCSCSLLSGSSNADCPDEEAPLLVPLAPTLPASAAAAAIAAAPPFLGSVKFPVGRVAMLALLVANSAWVQLLRDDHWKSGGGLGLGPEAVNLLGCTAALLIGYIFPALMALKRHRRPAMSRIPSSQRSLAHLKRLSTPRSSLAASAAASASAAAETGSSSLSGASGDWGWLQTAMRPSRSYGELSAVSSMGVTTSTLGPGHRLTRVAAVCMLVASALLMVPPVINLLTSSCELRSEGIFSRHHHHSTFYDA